MSEQTLAEKIRENQIANELATTQKRKQQAKEQDKIEADRKKAEDDYNKHIQQQVELQRQIDELEKQEAEQFVNDRNAITSKFSTQIAELESKKQKALSSISRTYQSYGSVGFAPPKWRTKTRSRLKDEKNVIIKRFNNKIKAIKRQSTKTINQFEFHVKYPGVSVGGSIGRTFRKSRGQVSLIKLYENRQKNIAIKKAYQRRTDIKNAQSNAIKYSEELEFTKKEFADKRDSTGFKVKPLEISKSQRITNLKLTQASKKRPEIKDSSFFKEHETSVIPDSIIGTTKLQSLQAFYTFAETQKLQSKLFFEQQKAQSGKEALEIRSRYRESNQYVGTANIYLNKGKVINQYGVLIEKKLDKKFSTDLILSESANPKLKVYKTTATPEKTLIETGLVKTQSSIPEYVFLDDDGNTKSITDQELFSYMSYLLNQTPKLPSKSDMILSNYMYENAELIQQTPTDQKGAYPITRDYPFERLILDHGTELRAGISNIFRPESEQEKYHPTLEALAFEDLISSGNAVLFGKPQPKESLAFNYLIEKSKTLKGKQEIAGSVVGSAIVMGATLLVPPLAFAKYGKFFIKPKTKKMAESIAQKLRDTPESLSLRKQLDLFPDMPESMKKKIIQKSRKENIVGIEMLDSRTALIKRGTELENIQSPYIIIKNKGKNPRSTIYEIYTQDKPGIYREILISGNQNKELTGGIRQTRDIFSYPGTPANLLKASQTDKLAKVGTAQAVKGLEQNPKYVIKAIEEQKVKTGSILLETERLDKVKSFNRDVSKIKKPDDVIPKGKTTKTNKDNHPNYTPEINLDLPKSIKPVTKTISTVTQRKQNLEKIIKDSVKNKPNTDFKVIGITGTINTTLVGLRENYTYTAKQGTKSNQTQKQKIKTDISSKQEIITDTKHKLGTRLKDLQTKLSLDPKYSLIVTGAQNEKTKTIPRYILKLKQDVTTTPPTVPPEEPITTTVIIPTFDIRLPGDPKPRQTARYDKGKFSKGFYIWNVDTERVGVYLPAPDISLGRTTKVITKIERLQKRTHTKKYAKTIQRREKNFFKLGTKSNKRQTTDKVHIVNISKPRFNSKNEKKRFKKNFEINFGF